MGIRRIQFAAVIVCGAFLVTGCQASSPLSPEDATDDDATSSSSSTASSSEEDDESDPAISTYASVSECLQGAWDIDKDAYAEMIGKAAGQPGGLTVKGSAQIVFSATDFVATYSNWQAIFEAPEGVMTQTTNGKETATWSLDASNRLTTSTVSDTTTSTLELNSPQGSMVLPTGEADRVGVEYSDFVVTCDATTVRLDGSEGYLVLTRRP
jgi:hypothetical protein